MQTLADGALAGPLLFGHGLVDDADKRRVGSVADSEKTAGDKGNAESAEIVAIGLGKGSKPELPSGHGDAFDGKTATAAAAGVRERICQTYGNCGGLGSETVDDLAIEGSDG